MLRFSKGRVAQSPDDGEEHLHETDSHTETHREGQRLPIGDDNKKYFLEKLKREVEIGRASCRERVSSPV